VEERAKSGKGGRLFSSSYKVIRNPETRDCRKGESFGRVLKGTAKGLRGKRKGKTQKEGGKKNFGAARTRSEGEDTLLLRGKKN